MKKMSEEYTFDLAEVLKELLSKWIWWGVMGILLGILLMGYRYFSDAQRYQEAVSTAQEQASLSVEPQLVEQILSETEKESVENAVLYYQVAQDRSEYREASALNKLNGSSAVLLKLRYQVASSDLGSALEMLRQHTLSSSFYENIASVVEDYRAEYISEVLTVEFVGTYAYISIWLPDSADPETVKNAIDASVQQNVATLKNLTADTLFTMEEADVSRQFCERAVSNQYASAVNSNAAQATLDAALSILTENAKIVYYDRIGVPYKPTGEAEVLSEVPSWNIKMGITGFAVGIVFYVLIYLCVILWKGRIYPRAVRQNLGADYAMDLWVGRKAPLQKKTVDKISISEQVSDTLRGIGETRRICLLQMGDLKEPSAQAIEQLAGSLGETRVSREKLGNRTTLELADHLKDSSTELIMVVDGECMSYRKVAGFMNEMRGFGFERFGLLNMHG